MDSCINRIPNRSRPAWSFCAASYGRRYLNGIDVLTSEKNHAVVTVGDSITDGAYSTIDGNARWPDILAQRLQADPHHRNLAVLNEAISGNRILREGAGPSAISRFDRIGHL